MTIVQGQTVSISILFAVLCCVVAAICIVLLVVVALKAGMRMGFLRAEREFSERVGRERNDAVKRSRAVLGGQFSEQLAPYFPGFPADPTEVRFIGKPVDFIAFSGSSEGSVSEIVFIEVKTGSAGLTKVERELKCAVQEGRVRYVEYRVPQ